MCFIIYKSQLCPGGGGWMEGGLLPSGRRLLIKLVPEGISSREIFVWYNSSDWLYCFPRLKRNHSFQINKGEFCRICVAVLYQDFKDILWFVMVVFH